MRTIIIRIKQFFFYLGYELTLFQKLVTGLLTAMLVTTLFFAAERVNISLPALPFLFGGNVRTDILADGTGGEEIAVRITEVDSSQLQSSGNVTVSYVLSLRPEGEYSAVARLLDADKQEVVKAEAKSANQSSSITVSVPEAKRASGAFNVELSVAYNGKTVLTTFSIPNGAGSGSIVPAGSGSMVSPIPLSATDFLSPLASISPSLAPLDIFPTPTQFPVFPFPASPFPSVVSSPSPSPSGSPPSPATSPRSSRRPSPRLFPTPSRRASPSPRSSPSGNPATQCFNNGQLCETGTDCCSGRCPQVRVSWLGSKSLGVCFPKR